MRARYGLEDRVVLGHVGRFDIRKNHERLLEIFAAFLQLEPRAMLVLIGTGRLNRLSAHRRRNWASQTISCLPGCKAMWQPGTS